MRITNAHDGSKVGKELLVRGQLGAIQGDAYVWLLVRREDFQPLWWPQRRAVVRRGEWSGLVVFGGPQDIDYKFDLAAVVVDEAAHRNLNDYWTNAMGNGHWPPISVPTPRCAHQVKVTKTR